MQGRFNLAAVNPNGQDYRNWHFRESMSWIRGRHTLKWGYEAYKIDWVLNNKYTQSRSVTFTGVITGDPMADFLLGRFDQLSVLFAGSRAARRSPGSTTSISRTSSRSFPG